MTLRSTLLTVLAAVAMAFAALTPAAAEEAKAPITTITINYHRPDGIYDKWGVHLWKSPNMPLEGVEWPNPMMPTGKNDFGVYWVKPASEFDTSHGKHRKVNYIIHQGDIKDQGGQDMAFDGMAHSEIWVYQGDKVIYYTLADVKAAHPDVK